MRETIFSILQGAWSSTTCSVDLNKATDSIYDYVNKMIDAVTDSCERQLSTMEDDIAELKYDNAQLTKDAESFELDMEASNDLLQECLPELNRLLEIQSNNPNKYKELNQLMFRIEEQIIKNGK